MLEIKPIFNALRRSKAGAMMLLLQIALTTAIVSNASFIINDRIQYLQQETGYPEQEIFSFLVFTYGSDVSLAQQFEEDETLLRNIPGVISATMMSEVPLSGSGSSSTFHLTENHQDSKGTRASYTQGDETTLSTLGLQVSAGRNFNADDIIHADDNSDKVRSVIVSQDFLDDAFPEGDGLGNTIYFGSNPMTIVGVVDTMLGPWLKDTVPKNYVIMSYVNPDAYQKFVVRTKPSERDAVMKQIEDLMLGAYSKRVITGTRGMDEDKANYNASDILMMRMLVVLVVVLVLVTALGIFGLTVFNISKRTKQIGTRRALGARKSAIMRYFLVENSLICVAGLVLGSVAALYIGKALLSYYSVPELDNTYILMTAVFVMIVSVLSVVLPANKAANISPSVATRNI